MTHQRIKNQLTPEFVGKQLRKLSRKDIDWVGHNCKFEMNVCYWQLGVRLNCPMWDTLVGSILLNENESHNLKIQHKKYVKEDETAEAAKFNDLFSNIQFPLIPTDVAYMYAAYDPIMTQELYEFQLPYLTEGTKLNKEFGLEKVAWVFHKVEMPLIEVLFEMEVHGVKIDMELMYELREKFSEDMDKYEQEFKQMVSEYDQEIDDLRLSNFESYRKLSLDDTGNVTVSITSSQQLAVLFYDIMGLTSPNKKKPRGTEAEILESFDLPITRTIVSHRKKAKLVSTYLNMDNFQANNDGRVHTNYKQNGARTGRMSSETPNLQNIPAHGEEATLIRNMFMASDGCYIVGSDYSWFNLAVVKPC